MVLTISVKYLRLCKMNRGIKESVHKKIVPINQTDANFTDFRQNNCIFTEPKKNPHKFKKIPILNNLWRKKSEV